MGRRTVAALVLIALLPSATVVAQHWSDDDIRKRIIEDSIARFGGDCPCPYSYAWNGRQCASNSAYMRHEPELYCYPQDEPPHLIRQYRERGL